VLLVCDIGNTTVVFGIAVQGEIRSRFRAESARGRTNDEWTQLLSSFALRNPGTLDGAACVSVVPPLEAPICSAIAASFGVTPKLLTNADITNLTIDYNPTEDVGTDRLVNAAYVFNRYKTPAAIVDLGTATTVDIVTDRGVYVGGAIAPGVEISRDALFSRTARLPKVDIAVPTRAVGKSTRQSLASGIFYSAVGGAKEILLQMEEEFGPFASVIATGGLAELIAPHIPQVTAIDIDLTLKGLAMLAAD